MKCLCLLDKAADFSGVPVSLVELGEQIIAFADIGSGGDSKPSTSIARASSRLSCSSSASFAAA